MLDILVETEQTGGRWEAVAYIPVQSYLVKWELFGRNFALGGTLSFAVSTLSPNHDVLEKFCLKRDCPTAFLASRLISRYNCICILETRHMTKN
jgi:hypothetical protein